MVPASDGVNLRIPAIMSEPRVETQIQESAPVTARGRRGRWVVAAALLLLVAFHAPLLRQVGEGLMTEPPAGKFDAVLILSGDHRLQAAVDLLESGRVGQIWLMEGRPDYVVAAGILPSEVESVRDRLAEMGVPGSQIEILGDLEVDDLPDAVRLLGARLETQPDLRLMIICGALSGRHVQYVLQDVLEPDAADRISILGLPYDRFPMQRWWRSRSGLKQVFNELCALGFTLVAGTEPQAPPPLVGPEAIEEELQQRFGEAACYGR